MTFQYFSLRNFLDKHALDEETRWWFELEQDNPELNPIQEYKNIIIELPYENKVSYDLETRVISLVDLFNGKRSNKKYLMKMLIKLQDKCEQEGRSDLVKLLDRELQERVSKL